MTSVGEVPNNGGACNTVKIKKCCLSVCGWVNVAFDGLLSGQQDGKVLYKPPFIYPSQSNSSVPCSGPGGQGDAIQS